MIANKAFLLFLALVIICKGSPFIEVDEKMQSMSGGKIHLKRSFVAEQEIGVFSSSFASSAYDPLLRISTSEWIDPYGLLRLKASQIKEDSIQKIVWDELVVGRQSAALLSALRTIPPTSPSFLTILMLKLLQAPQASPLLGGWLQLLPKTVQGTIMWSDDELSLLQGSPLLGHTEKIKETLAHSYSQLERQLFSRYKSLFPSHVYSFERFSYAYQLVLSRSILVGSGEAERRVIIPLIDLFNHKPLPDKGSEVSFSIANAVMHYNAESEEMLIISISDIPAKSEIFINYGDLSNQDLLLNFGFVVKDNIDNFYDLTLEDPNIRSMTVHLIDPFTDHTISKPPIIHLNAHNLIGTSKLLWWQRLCHLKFTELGHTSTLYTENQFISVENELEAIRGSMEILRAKLDAYPTSSEYDIHFLNSHPNLNHRVMMAIKHRLDEKNILRTSIGHLRVMWKYILDTGEAVALEEVLGLSELPKRSQSSVIPPGQVIDLIEYSSHAWDSLEYLHDSETTKLPVTSTTKDFDSPIERSHYIPIFTDTSNEIGAYEKNMNGMREGKLKVAILVASKVDKEVKDSNELDIIRYLIKSIVETLTKEEMKKYFLTFYIGFDTGDRFYDSSFNMKKLYSAFSKLSDVLPVEFRIICTGDTHGAPARSWSALGNVAYHDGNEYFFQVNDDVTMLTEGWLTNLVAEMKRKSNLGVTGPADIHRNLLTQAFIHRTHFQIFDRMYPFVFKNWYMDDWMQLVYGKLASVTPNCSAENSPRTPRYEIDRNGYEYLNTELAEGCIAIQLFLRHNRHPQWHTWKCTRVNPTLGISEFRSVLLHPEKYSFNDPIPDTLLVNSEFYQILKEVSNEDNIVMITFTNLAFIKMTANWILNVQLLGISNYLVIALDEMAYNVLLRNDIPCFYDPNFSSSPDSAAYLEGHYRELVNLKTLYNLRILSLGFHTLLCDNDIALLENPFDHLSLDNGYDIQIQDDSPNPDVFDAVNTGFQLTRSNLKTVLFYNTVYDLTQADASLQDQRAYNTILQKTRYKYLLHWEVLDPLYFPNGWVYFVDRYPQQMQVEPVIIHNNWIRGLDSKIHRFREEHLWLVDDPVYFSTGRFLTYPGGNSNIKSYEDQTEELKAAILICKLLDRILILPKFQWFDTKKDLFSNTVHFEMLYDVTKILEVVEIRENGFLSNPAHKKLLPSPLENAELIDVISVGSESCFTKPTGCFQPQHQGYINIKNGKGIATSKLLGVKQIGQLLNNTKIQDTPLIILPSIHEKFDQLELNFPLAFRNKLNDALTLRSAPHK